MNRWAQAFRVYARLSDWLARLDYMLREALYERAYPPPRGPRSLQQLWSDSRGDA